MRLAHVAHPQRCAYQILFILFVAAVFVAASPFAFAQTTEDVAKDTPVVQPLTQPVEPKADGSKRLVISASRIDEEENSAASTLSVIRDAEI
jgi:hypothetical protein